MCYRISTLPASLAVLSNLQVLLAGCNPLENIENGLFSSLPSLQRLDIGFSELLEQLPNDFSACQSLEILEAGNGRLKSLPASLFRCEKLQELQLYGNILKTISEDLGFLRSLRILNVGRNQIEALPQSIANCTALETLYLYENCLSALPMGVSKLEKLKTLKVDCNADMPIPPREIRCLPSVQATAAFYATGTIN